MAQYLRGVTAVPDGLSFTLSTYMVAHNPLLLHFWRIWFPLLASIGTGTCGAQTYICRQSTHTHKIKIKCKKENDVLLVSVLLLLVSSTPYGHICIFCQAAGLSGVSVTSNIPHGLTEKPELVIEQPGTSRIPAPKPIFKNAHCLPLEVAKIASYYSEYCQREVSKHLSCPSCPNHISREPNGS